MKLKFLVVVFGIVLSASLVENIHQYRESMAAQTEQETALLKSIGGRQKLAKECLELRKELGEMRAEVRRLKACTPLLYVFTDGTYWSFISDEPFPKHKRLRRTLEFIPWDGDGEAVFHPDPKGYIAVPISIGGCGNNESTIFLQKICEQTVVRHPDDPELTTSRDKCLERWIEDEANIAVGVEDGEGLSPEEIVRRIDVHFNRIFEENHLGVSARGQGWPVKSLKRIFIN